MPELKDGESVEVQGSARRPYLLKNVGGVLSCSCPAWRFQSLPIEQRTCRHLRNLRGSAAEDVRLGGDSFSTPAPSKPPVKAPPLLLAESWNRELNPTGYWLSEKLDGVRAFWDGMHFVSRQGNRFHAPSWFTVGLPLEPLDGELWIGRKQFQKTVSIVRRRDEPDAWRGVRFLIFDAPADPGTFEARLRVVDAVIDVCRPRYAQAHPHILCTGHDHLQQEMDRIELLGGEGVMLRQPGSIYAAGRSATLLKVKRFHDAEARVIGYEPGTGRHKGRMGALLVEMANGIRFEIGTGFTDAQRDRPVPIGSTISFKYQEMTERGVPRFASFMGIRADMPIANNPISFKQGDMTMPGTTVKRRFEFVEGSSDKFWEISVNGNEVIVCFGRNGTSGQTETKSFADASTAQKHADKKIGEKVKKGYVEVR
jgi:DNA ligase 1